MYHNLFKGLKRLIRGQKKKISEVIKPSKYKTKLEGNRYLQNRLGFICRHPYESIVCKSTSTGAFLREGCADTWPLFRCTSINILTMPKANTEQSVTREETSPSDEAFGHFVSTGKGER